MQTAKLFTNGRSQAVRLPKESRFSGNDVFTKKIGISSLGLRNQIILHEQYVERQV